MKRTISTSDASAAVGAYSQATTNGELLLIAGQLPLMPDSELLDDASVGGQTEQCLENVVAILAAEGMSLDDVLRTTVFLDNIDDFEELNEVYGEFFDEGSPTRNTVEIDNVSKGAAIEIEVVVVTEQATHH